MMEKFFNPTKVAIIGASADPNKVGFSLFKNALSGQCQVYPVSLTTTEILGQPTYKSVLAIPDPIDLAIIAVKAQVVPQVLEECGRKQISNVIIVSSGFKEVGEAGLALEAQIKKLLRITTYLCSVQIV